MDEPVADTVRGILDGHIVLSRELAQAYHYPAIDVLQSISRLASGVSGHGAISAAGVIRRNMASYARAEDLINVGAYQNGSNPEVDEAIRKHPSIENFLIQEVDEPSTLEETMKAMSAITGVEISEEEMTDNNAKLPAKPKLTNFNAKTSGEETRTFPAEDTAMALNSVAALFSSL
jgi:flagellum-specific ATP synthase